MKLQKPNLCQIITGLIVLVFLVSVGFNIKTGIKDWRGKIFNEGMQAGRIEGASQIWNMLANQYQTLRRLELPANTPEGGTTTIIFLPQQ